MLPVGHSQDHATGPTSSRDEQEQGQGYGYVQENRHSETTEGMYSLVQESEGQTGT
jgi:hypothetical protein